MGEGDEKQENTRRERNGSRSKRKKKRGQHIKGSRGFHEGGPDGSQDPLILPRRFTVSNQITEPLSTNCKCPKGHKGQSGSRTTTTPILGDGGCPQAFCTAWAGRGEGNRDEWTAKARGVGHIQRSLKVTLRRLQTVEMAELVKLLAL